MKRRYFITLIGSMAAWPLGAHAQQPANLRTVGFLNSAALEDWGSQIAAFRQGLSDTGYAESRNVTLAFRFAD